jgi:hypothetical protein
VVRAEAAASGLDSLVFAVGPALLRSIEFRKAGGAQQTEVLDELHGFEHRATRGGVLRDQVDAVRGLLFAVLEGDVARGAAQIGCLAEDPKAGPDLLEALYHCACVGFAGEPALEPLEHGLFARLSMHRNFPAEAPSAFRSGNAAGFPAVGPRVTARSVVLAPLVLAARAFDRLRSSEAPVYAVLGSSGSGKSSLLGCIAAGSGAECVFIEASGPQRNAAQLVSEDLRSRLCGVLATLDVTDILDPSGAPRPSGVQSVRQQMRDLDALAGAHLPVYLVLTKADRIPGFEEYFAGMDESGRRQLWGVTFDLMDSHSGRALRTLPVTFDAMIAGLNSGLTRRLTEERRPFYRQRLYAFPRRVAALKTEVLAQVEQLVGAVPGTTHLFLRGAYVTSSGAGESNCGWFIDGVARDVLLPEKALFRRGRWHLKW